MNIVYMSLQICCRSMAHPVAQFNFNAFLEKEKLKSNGSNFTDWFRNLRIILTAAQKAYVLDATLGDPLQQMLLKMSGMSISHAKMTTR